MDLYDRLLVYTYHIIVLVVYKVFSKSIMNKEVLCSPCNNKELVELVQCKDDVEVVNTSSRDYILYKFLNYNARL